MAGCHDARNAVTIKEVPCPQCGEIIECFNRDGHHAAEVKCENCGYVIETGEAFIVNHQEDSKEANLLPFSF